MTISTTTSRVDYAGNGVTTAFAVPFAFFGASELTVIERSALGVETTKALTTDYTVAGGNGSTGTVTAVVAPASGVQWTILRSTARTQLTDYVSNDAFPAETHERALDRLQAQVQEVERDAARALLVPATDSGASLVIPTSTARASNYLAFDASGNPIAVSAAAGGAVVTPFMETVLDDVNATAALTTLGGTAIGRAIFTAATAAAVRVEAALDTMNNLVRNLAAAPAARTAGFTLALTDLGVPQVFTISAIATLSLPALSGVPSGASVWLRNAEASTAWVVIDPNGTETVNGQTVMRLFPGESVQLFAASGGWLAFGVPDFGWRRVLRTNASASAQVDFALPPGFSMYRVEISGMRPATDGAQPLMRTSTDGTTFDAGATDYTGLGIVMSTATGGAPSNATSGILSGAIDTGATTESGLATIDFFPGDGTVRPLANVTFSFPSNGTSAIEQQIRSFRRNSSTTVVAIRFLMSTGNITDGQFALFARV